MTLTTAEIYVVAGLSALCLLSLVILVYKFWDEGITIPEVIAVRMFVISFSFLLALIFLKFIYK